MTEKPRVSCGFLGRQKPNSGAVWWRGGGFKGGGGSYTPPFIFIAPPPRYDYKIAREYNWNVKNKASKGYEENYFFIFREGDGVYYNELETRWGPGGGPEGAGTPPQKKKQTTREGS